MKIYIFSERFINTTIELVPQQLHTFCIYATYKRGLEFSSYKTELRTFTNHRTTGEGGGHFFNSSLPLSPASQTLNH